MNFFGCLVTVARKPRVQGLEEWQMTCEETAVVFAVWWMHRRRRNHVKSLTKMSWPWICWYIGDVWRCVWWRKSVSRNKYILFCSDKMTNSMIHKSAMWTGINLPHYDTQVTSGRSMWEESGCQAAWASIKIFQIFRRYTIPTTSMFQFSGGAWWMMVIGIWPWRISKAGGSFEVFTPGVFLEVDWSCVVLEILIELDQLDVFFLMILPECYLTNCSDLMFARQAQRLYI